MRARRWIDRCLILGLLVCLVSGSMAAQTLKPVAPADQYRHPRSELFYTETWAYVCMTDYGAPLIVTFLYSNLGVTSGTLDAYFSFTTPEGQHLMLEDERSTREYQEWPAAQTQRFGAGQVVRREGEVRVRFVHPRARVELTLRPWMAGFELPGNLLRLTPDSPLFQRTWYDIPRADMQATVTVDGKTWQVKGAGLSDHVVQNMPATRFAYTWSTLRGYFPNHTVSVLDIRRLPEAGGGRYQVLYVTDRRQVLGVSTAFSLRGERLWKDPIGYVVPQRFVLQAQAGEARVSGSWQTRGLVVRNALLERLSFVKRQLVSWFAGNPIIYRYFTDASLEVRQKGQTEPLTGRVFHEVSVLQPPPGWL